MADTVSAFVEFMRSVGCGPADPSEIIADDRSRRFRIDGDKPKTRNGSYQLREDANGFAVGRVRSFRDGVTHSWHNKSPRRATAEDRAEWKRRVDEAKAAQDAERLATAQAASDKAARLWASAAQTGTTPYLQRKRITGLHGARVRGDIVTVPMRAGGKIVGLQFIAADGAKRFLTGCEMAGAYHAMAGRSEALDRIIIAEGYATAAAIRETLGLPTIVAFTAGNLKPVALAIHVKHPDAEIIIAADNDQWTVKPDGTPYNAGVIGAHQAAVAIGGCKVIAPQVAADDPDRRTDWDDIKRTDGQAAIRAAFDAAMNPPEPEAAPDREPERGDWQPQNDVIENDPLDDIRPLGHNRREYSFFPKAAGQIVTLSASSLGRIQNLYLLAPRGFWERHYSPDGKTPDSTICAYASAHLMEACHKAGIFQKENARGVGAWVDGKTALVNCGDLIVTSDGRRAHPAEFQGEYVYESGPRTVALDADAATNREAAALLDLCKALKWKRPQYGVLLAGWCVIAQIGGALKWRPHIWITGRAGSGKTWAIKSIISPTVGRIGITRDGGTTEAGLRKAVGASARPVILDEAESQNAARQSETEKILALLRGASSGSVVENAYSTYQVNSCFALGAIIPRIEQVADKERITLLELVRDESKDRAQNFKRLENAAYSLLTPEYSKRLFARTVENIETLLANIAVFSDAASEEFGNKRSGDQIGPMLAGAYSLTTTKRITIEAAREWIARQNWDWHTESYDDSDAVKLVTYIMTSRVRYDSEGMSREATIGDLVAHMSEPSHPSFKAADKALRSYGIRVMGDDLAISNTAPNMRRLLKDTQYIPWQRTLQDFPGARSGGTAPVYFMPGLNTKCMLLPLAEVMGGEKKRETDVELPFGDEGDFA